MLLVDAHFKWPKSLEMTSTVADNTIATLRCVFSTNGLPEQLVTDNGLQFVSCELTDFNGPIESSTPALLLTIHHPTEVGSNLQAGHEGGRV